MFVYIVYLVLKITYSHFNCMPICTLCKRDFKDFDRLICHFFGDHDLNIKQVRSAVRRTAKEIIAK